MAKVAGVEVTLSANSSKLLTELERSRKEVLRLRKTTEKSARSIGYAFNKLRRAAQLVASAFIFTAGVKQIGKLVLGIERAQESITLLQSRFEQFGRTSDSFARAYNLSQELGVSLESTGEGMARLLIATKAMGTTVQQLENVQKNLVLLGRAGGTSAEEMKGAIIQLTQGMASGRLQGEELRSVLENLPLVAMEIADEMGINIGLIREFAAEGKITGDVVVDAMQSVKVKVEELPETFSMATSRMSTEWQLFLAQLGAEVDTEGLVNQLTWRLRAARSALGGVEYYRTLTNERLKQLFATEADLEKLKEINQVLRERQQVQANIDKAESARLEMMLEEIDVTKLPGMKETGLDQFVKRFQTIDDRIKSAREWLALFKDDIINIYGKEKFDQIAADIQKIGGELKEIDLNTIPRLKTTAGKAFEEMSEFAKQAARNMQDVFAEFLFDPFDEGLKGMLKGFLDVIRRMLANQLAAQFFTDTGLGALFGGGRALGGPVMAGTPYLVGERGPELIVPDSNSMVIPNHKLGGGGVVNNYHFEAGADIATIRTEIIPMLERTSDVTIARMDQRRREGRV